MVKSESKLYLGMLMVHLVPIILTRLMRASLATWVNHCIMGVVYFNQRLGAAYPKRWLKYAILSF